MMTSRPLPKELLKRMFLKVLHEHHRPRGRYNGHSWDSRGIARQTIAEYFELEPALSQDEQDEALRGVFELERDGFIEQDPTQGSSSFKRLSAKGRQFVDQDLEHMHLPAVDIDTLLSRPDLLSRVRDDYLMSDYEGAIFKAFRLLEERVRQRAMRPAASVGAALMTEAFRPGTGALQHPGAATDGEAEGLHHLMRGAIMWFKNPVSHRTVEHDDAAAAAQVLAFANVLLDLVDVSTVRSGSS